MNIQEIIFTNLPKLSTNEIYSGKHRRLRKADKDTYRLLTAKKIKTELDPCDEKIDLSFTFYFAGRELDSSNTTYMGKLIEDCLKTFDKIEDDSPKYVGRFSTESKKNPNKDGNDYCHLRISPAKD